MSAHAGGVSRQVLARPATGDAVWSVLSQGEEIAMVCYPVYLETGADGRCLAHVPDLPGCVVRAPSRDEVLPRLPEAIRDHHAWLRRHGEPAPEADTPIEVQIAGESTGFGPFDPGDAAALFPPDQGSILPQEMEEHLRLMAHSRADLLTLVRELPGELLDWKLDPQSFTIRRLLRHVGNAEQWYVSRLVPPETLPPEWEGDEDLPILEFLEMERRTAVARLRQLTESELLGVFFPTAWTDHPHEAWTARKVLRRFVEHEREHTAQAREILAARRGCLLARLAAERAGLLWQLVDLDERALTEMPFLDDWTAVDLMAHVAAWDRWEHRAMGSMVAGEAPDLSALGDFDASNAAFVAAWRERTAGLSPGEALSEVLTELQAARLDWVAWLETLPDEEFFRRRFHSGYDWSFATVPLPVQWEHDAAHGGQIAASRQAAGLGSTTGPKAVLLAALAAAREELLAAAALVPPEERTSRLVCGEWTLRDVVGHVADWEWFGVEGLRLMAAGQPPQVELVEDIDSWNQAHAQARRNQPWELAWTDLHASRETLLGVLRAMDQEILARTFAFPWGGLGTPHGWIRIYLAHDREHARDLRGEEGEDLAGGS